MSLRDFSTRNKEVTDVVTSEAKIRHSKNKITCDTMELRELITKWTQNEGWKYENFADFIELVGIKTPVRLSELDKKSCSFKCVTALDTEIRISLSFGDWIESFSEIHVEDGEKTTCYIINYELTESEKCIPKVTRQSRSIKKYGKELDSYYCEHFCHRTLKLDDTHILEIKISEPDKCEDESENFVLRNCEDIEEYLLSLDNSLVVAEVYKKMMKFMDFSNKEIFKCKSILISYIETINKEELERGKVLLVNGKMQEYAILENGETFHVFKNGNFKYLSDSGIRISYLENTKQYVLSITGFEKSIITANPNEIINRVKVKISELWKFVR